jgi:hypothetical protein
LKIYLGFKEGNRPDIIHFDSQPTRESHPKYDLFFGPFKTVEEASNSPSDDWFSLEMGRETI